MINETERTQRCSITMTAFMGLEEHSRHLILRSLKSVPRQ